MKKNACNDYERVNAVFKNSTVILRGASTCMSLFNHIGSIEPGDLVQISGQPLQVGDISHLSEYGSLEMSGHSLTGVYLSLNNPKTGSCEVLIQGRVRSFWHPGISVTLLARGSDM